MECAGGDTKTSSKKQPTRGCQSLRAGGQRSERGRSRRFPDVAGGRSHFVIRCRPKPSTCTEAKRLRRPATPRSPPLNCRQLARNVAGSRSDFEACAAGALHAPRKRNDSVVPLRLGAPHPKLPPARSERSGIAERFRGLRGGRAPRPTEAKRLRRPATDQAAGAADGLAPACFLAPPPTSAANWSWIARKNSGFNSPAGTA